MGLPDFQIACVGKPSAGKSSFLNAVSNASAKVGNYPFTTIKPNQGIAYYTTDCACGIYRSQMSSNSICDPKYGKCVNSVRWVPVRVLDVAGLVPGASQGEGLGNQFLDDLRHANVLLHVVDVSGTTDEKGKETVGYDPINDIDWLYSEIKTWIINNLESTWPSAVRKAMANKIPLDRMLLRPFSGYGANLAVIRQVVSCLPAMLRDKTVSQWTAGDRIQLVDFFVEQRFPMIFVLNKIDLPDSDANISRIFEKYKREVNLNRVVLVSALAESFLRKMKEKKFILYEPGTDLVYTKADIDAVDDITIDLPDEFKLDNPAELKDIDSKNARRLENILDMVVFRFGNTGCMDVIKAAVEAANLVPFFPVGAHNFTPLHTVPESSTNRKLSVFRDCHLVPSGMKVLDIIRAFYTETELSKGHVVVEAVDGRQVSEDDSITRTSNNVLCFKYKPKD